MTHTPHPTRTRILDAAERLFAERGYDATPTSAIAHAAEVPKGLLFYHFPAKTDLLRALIGERLDLDPIDTTSLVALGDPARALLNVTRRLHELQEATDVRRVIVWREQRTHPEVRTRLREYRTQLEGVVERVLGASLVHPIAARRLRAAASAWVAIISMPAPDDDAGSEVPDVAERSRLPELAELISAGLREPAA
ncbi:TetR/AcrR family transcriptional regulator [Agromyces aurantiacus]|uniref:TetR/AcrR family transcriptional regulator n=1 Tax=Agromyces aurantiacus TaxID=165814 RepID=A0ABV9R771_9MICO|nr:TetR/AcrR family transcriptional regulator [Agromyces aurantiacus]MBM7505118.1 AcrR family transcriptional regulator [Agromyces aurantiacus]